MVFVFLNGNLRVIITFVSRLDRAGNVTLICLYATDFISRSLILKMYFAIKQPCFVKGVITSR